MDNRNILALRKFVAPEFVFGAGASALAGQYLGNFQAASVLLVTDPGLEAAGWAGKIKDHLLQAGLRVTVFSQVTPNPRDEEVMAGAELYRSRGCEAILGLGGGSPLDCAKGIGAVISNGGHVLDFEGVDQVAQPCPPLVCVPTTSGSAADVSQFAIINDTERRVKIAIVSKAMVPDVSLIDPDLTATMPPDLTAHTGLDALTHAVEAYVSNASSPITDQFALSAIRRVFACLPRAFREPGDAEARAGMQLACLEAGLAFSNAILGAVHAMAHSLGGLLDLPHGECNAILLPGVMEFNAPACPERFVDMARTLQLDCAPEAAPAALIAAVQALKKTLGVTRTLSDIGVRPEDLDSLAEKALHDPCLLTNPRPAALEDLKALYRRAM
jgi:alcohol dehydrogenase class IV